MVKSSGKIKYVVLALVVVGGVYAYQNMGQFLVRAAEKIASGALGVPVDVEAIDVSLSDKKVTVRRLQIGNPPGYTTPYAMTADAISIGLNAASKTLINFKDITVKGSVIYVEMNDKGNLNLNDLKTLANRKEQKQSAGSEQVRVIIQQMAIEASTIHPTISLLGGREIAPITLPAIRFSNIGKGGNGMAASEAIVQIIGKYFAAAQKEIQASGILPSLPDIPANVDEVGKAVEDVGGGLKKLFQ